MSLPDELRLLLCLLLNAGVFISAFRFVRRVGRAGISQSLCDAFLLLHLIEYVAVALPGALHCLSLATMCAVALVAIAALVIAARKDAACPFADNWTVDNLLAVAASLFAAGYLLSYAWNQRWIPPMATDSLVYQLSTPVLWLRKGSLATFPTWYWNPANSYAPQCSTCAFVWLLAPMNCDVLARYAQAPALLWLFLLCYRMGSELCLGLSSRKHGLEARATAAWVAVAAVLSRPLFSEALFAKDDLFVTAFAAATILSCSRSNLRDRLGPWRLGAALGMTLASKYTVLLICPIFLFLIDAPIKAAWSKRDFAIALLVAATLSAPWYLRNIVLTGNPLFPADVKILGVRIFTGLFGTERDQQLRSAHGAWQMLASTYHSLPIALLAVLALIWVGAVAACHRTILRDPLQRACVLGSVLVLLLFLVASPHHEVRYLFPLIVVWFACATLAISRWMPTYRMQVCAAILLAAISTVTSFSISLLDHVALLAVSGITFAGAGVGLILLLHSRPRFRMPAAFIAFVASALGIYVYWHAYLNLYRDGCIAAWLLRYPNETPAWQFVREELPDNANVAIANTQFTYPLYGFNFQRDVAYAPTRLGLHSFQTFPRMGDDVPGDLIVQTMTRVMLQNPDKATWLENLRAMHARYLLVFNHGLVDDPPEMKFAASNSGNFDRVFSDGTAAVYQIRW